MLRKTIYIQDMNGKVEILANISMALQLYGTLETRKKCIDSLNIFGQQLIAIGVLETAAGSVEEDSIAVLRTKACLSSDGEPTVRSDLVEKFLWRCTVNRIGTF